MIIRVINYGYDKMPSRAHYNDAGADVYATETFTIKPGETVSHGLKFGVRLPDGYMLCMFPKSGLSSKGIVSEIPPIDSGYTGEIHAIIHNGSNSDYTFYKGDKVAQAVMMPILMPTFIAEEEAESQDSRGSNGFGSTGV